MIPPIILVTGFLGHPEGHQTALKDNEERIRATVWALDKILTQAGDAEILLAFTGCREQFERLLSIISWREDKAFFYVQDIDKIRLGKGALENDLIKQTIIHWDLSRLNTGIIKITAKYYPSNLARLLHFFSKDRGLIFGWRFRKGDAIDTRCFFFKPRAYLEMQDVLGASNDSIGYYYENCVFDCMKRLSLKPGFTYYRPLVFGLSGSTGSFDSPIWIKRLLVRCVSWY